MSIASLARATEYSPESYLKEGLKFERRGEYFQAARYYFQALQRADTGSYHSLAYAYISNALLANNLPQGASYFFLKAIGTGDDRAIRVALRGTRTLIDSGGTEVFRKYLLKYTKEDQYPEDQRDYYLYVLAEDRLFNQKPEEVVHAVSNMGVSFVRYPSALFLRGTANLLLGNVEAGAEDFKNCADSADKGRYSAGNTKNESRELKNRCLAGAGRRLQPIFGSPGDLQSSRSFLVSRFRSGNASLHFISAALHLRRRRERVERLYG
jgi:tetratricopeptide (TPR) repeat protein